MNKKLILPAIAFAVLSVCASQGYAQEKKVAPAAKVIVPTAAEIAAGKALVAKSDCMACHKLDVKLVGPGFKEVAKKYPATSANRDTLAKKVIGGGSGVWGAIPMSPHPAITLPDARKIITYVLSVK